jgi:hypothetical protein
MAELSVVLPPKDPPDAESLGAAPLTITYYLTGEIAIETTVLGEARNVVNVAILAGSLTVWSGTLTQQAPNLKTTYAITVGKVTIETGAEFELTIPTQLQPGQVFLKCIVDQQGVSTPFNGQVATWKLTG